MAVVLGLAAKLYRNTNTYASPSWAEVENIRDATITLTHGEADATTRNNNGYVASVPTLKTLEISFEMVWDTGDADFVAFRDAWINKTPIEVLALDGAVGTAGSNGPRATCYVFDITRGEPLADVVKATVRLKPGYATNAPSWYTAV